jgi:hypothetical protein
MIYTHAAAALAGAALAFAGAWQVQGWRMDAQLSQLKTEYATAQARAVEKAHAETIRLQTAKDDAERLAAKRQSDLARAAAAVRVERDGLRDELAAARVQLPDASCTSVRQYAATLSAVFGECSAEIEGLAGPAGGHASDSLKLQEGWPTQQPK